MIQQDSFQLTKAGKELKINTRKAEGQIRRISRATFLISKKLTS